MRKTTTDTKRAGAMHPPGQTGKWGRRGRGRSLGRVRRLAGVAALAVLTAGSLEAQDVHRLGGREIAVYNLAGRVEVVSGSGSEVVVRVQRGGSDADRLSIETGTIGGRETLRVVYPFDEVVYPRMGRGSTTVRVRGDGTFSDGRGGGDRIQVRGSGGGPEAWADLVVEVPAGRDTEIYLAVGEAEARGVEGDLRVDTGSGTVTASDITGALEVDTGSGGVEVMDVQGDVSVDTGSGSIRAARLSGRSVELDTGSGGVELDGVEADDLRVDTGSGAVRVAGVRAPRISIDTGSGSVDAELLADVQELVVDTGSGGVTVRVPEDFGAEVHLETGSGRIDVDVPVEVRSVSRDQLRGSLGDGRGALTIDTGSGGIRLLRGG